MDMAGESSESSRDEITVWADIRCPWCWMGHRRLRTAGREAVAEGVGSTPTYVHAGHALSGARSVDELVGFLSGAEARR
jgi:predicted DsbA family dithiol-disulfide isomerase